MSARIAARNRLRVRRVAVSAAGARGSGTRGHACHARKSTTRYRAISEGNVLLTGVRNSVRDRLDVPQKILARGGRPSFACRFASRARARLVRLQLNETAINRLANVIYDARDIYPLHETLSKEKTSKTFSLFKERLLFTM